MLDEFLELNTKNKLKVISALYTYNTISQKTLCDVLNISFRGVSSLIESINADILNVGVIKRTDEGLSLIRNDDVNFFQLFRSISKNSTTLLSLRFLLMNESHRPFLDFAQEIYLTKSSAYRTRKRCCEFLEKIGLEVDDNYVVGNEYRIRFLIGLIHYKYGVDCYEMDPESLRAVRTFELATNGAINEDYLNCAEMEYGYFEYLVMLSWKRARFSPKNLGSRDLDRHKEVFVYWKMREALAATIGSRLDFTFEEADFDYLYLVYCCTNNCVFADQWTEERAQVVYKITMEDPIFVDLTKKLSEVLPSQVAESSLLRTVLIYFYKKCILGLQCIIPDKNFFTNQEKGVFTDCIFRSLADVVSRWLRDNGNVYPIDDDHILYLSLQIEHILRLYVEPVNVLVLSDLNAEVDVMSRYLMRLFSPERIRISKVLLNSQPRDWLCQQRNSVVIVNKKFMPVIHCLGLERENVVVPISAEFTANERDLIEDAVLAYEDEGFLRLLEEAEFESEMRVEG